MTILPFRSPSTPSQRAAGDAWTPAPQMMHPARILDAADRHHSGFDVLDRLAEEDRHPELFQRPPGVVREVWRKAGEEPRASLDEKDARLGRIDVAEIPLQRMARQFGDRPRHFDAGRSAADDDRGQEHRLLDRIRADLGLLEGDQQSRADGPGVFEIFRTGRHRRPFVVAEVAVGRTGRDHQPVERDGAVGEHHPSSVEVDAGNIAADDIDIGMAREQPADRLGDVAGRQRRRRHLVEKGHEQVVVAPVDDRDLDRGAAEAAGAGEPAETGADDDHMHPAVSVHGKRPYLRRISASTATMTMMTPIATIAIRRAGVASR